MNRLLAAVLVLGIGIGMALGIGTAALMRAGGVVAHQSDYTVVGKAVYAGGGTTGPKVGYYVTIVLAGTDRETYMGTDPKAVAGEPKCFTDAKVGQILSPECR